MSRTSDTDSVRRSATMWIEIVYLQAARLEYAIERFSTFVFDQEEAELTDAEDCPPRTNPVANAAADAYFFLLAVAQLIKCVGELPDDHLPNHDDAHLLRLLRDFNEHWEDPHGKAGSSLRRIIPDISPGRFHYTKKEVWFEGVSLTATMDWVGQIDDRLRDYAPPFADPTKRPFLVRDLFRRLHDG